MAEIQLAVRVKPRRRNRRLFLIGSPLGQPFPNRSAHGLGGQENFYLVRSEGALFLCCSSEASISNSAEALCAHLPAPPCRRCCWAFLR